MARTGSLFTEIMSDYQRVIDAWLDPYPAPIIETVQLDTVDVHVVRDDLLCVGSKVRFLDCLVGHFDRTRHIDEWVYGSCPANGYGQISLAHVCRRYNKRAVLFMAKRTSTPHEYQQRALDLGAHFEWVEHGRLSVTQSRAKHYVEASLQTRKLLPIGLEHPLVSLSIVKVASALDIQPTDVWSVGGSGLLNRGLQDAWPSAACHVVSTGHTMKDVEVGRAQLHTTRYRFSDAVAPMDAPPFPSAPTYDAKAWHVMRDWYRTHDASGPILFWNVGA